MNTYNHILVLLLICMPWMLFAQEKDKSTAGAAKGKTPQAYEVFFKKGMKKTDGILPVYREGTKYYLEISEEMLGKDLLATGVITRGGWVGLASDITDMLTFTLGEKNRLEVRKKIYSDRVDESGTGADMAAAVEASSLKPISYFYPIVAYGPGKKGYIIDISSDINVAGNLFAFPNLQWVNRPDATRSGLDSVYRLDNGVKFVCLHTQTDYMPGGPGGPGYDKHSSVIIEWTLQRLPELSMPTRLADSRIGYNTLSFNDYSRNPHQVERTSVIRRWSVQVKPEDTERYKGGELVEPVLPIRVYFDDSFSDFQKAAAKRGLEEWNACFEQAGFKNVLQVQDGLPETAFGYHQIVFSYLQTAPKLYSVSDPRTGEMLSARVILSDSDFKNATAGVSSRLRAYEPLLLTDSLDNVVREECLRYMASNMTGAALGLRPNMAGSAAYTSKQLRDAEWVKTHGISSSVTDDCVVNFVVQPGDGIPFRDLFAKVSTYDRWAIEWGYRAFPGLDERGEKQALRAIAVKAKDNPELYYGSKDVLGFRSGRGDLASDKLNTALLGIESMKKALPHLKEAARKKCDEKDSWDNYFNLVNYGAYSSYVAMAADYIGDVCIEPIIAGYNEESLHYMPKEKQKEAMRFLEKYAFSGAPAWMQDSVLRDVAGVNWKDNMDGLMNMLSLKLMSPELMVKLTRAEETLGKNAYTLNDLFGDVNRIVFMNYDANKAVDRYQMKMQYLFMTNFIKTFSRYDILKYPNDLSLSMLAQMKKMSESLEKLGRLHANAESRQHYRGMSVVLQRSLAPKEKEAGIPMKK